MHSQVVIPIQVSYLEALFCTCQYVAINTEYLSLFTASTTCPCHRIKPVFPHKNNCPVYPRMVIRCTVRYADSSKSRHIHQLQRDTPFILRIKFYILSIHCIRALIIEGRCKYSDCLPSDCRRGILFLWDVVCGQSDLDVSRQHCALTSKVEMSRG